MPNDDLNTADILSWSGQQADLLRRLARGERVNGAIDWENLIEEVESVGRSELTAVGSLLGRAIEHLLKVHGWPRGPVEKWRHEAQVFLIDARKRYAPSMASMIDIAAVYSDAWEVISGVTYRRTPPRQPPDSCPFTLQALIVARRGKPDLGGLLAALERSTPGNG